MIQSIGMASMSQTAMTQHADRPSPEEMFQRLDADGSGGLDRSELQAMIDRMAERHGGEGPSAEELMSSLDNDGDGTVSFEEHEAGRPQGPPPGGGPRGAPPESGTATETDLLQRLLEAFAASDEEDTLYEGVLA